MQTQANRQNHGPQWPSVLAALGFVFLTGTLLTGRLQAAPVEDTQPAGLLDAVARQHGGNPSTEPSGQRAAQLLDQYIKATGGRAAFDRLRNRLIHASMDIGAQGGKLSMTIYSAKPNKLYTVVDIPGVGKAEHGTDGKIAWEKSVMGQARIQKGTERTSTIREGIQDRFVYWRDLFTKVDYAGVEEIAGKKCHKITLTPKPIDPAVTDSPQTVWMDPDTHYIVQINSSVETAGGSIPVSIGVGDYREIDQVRIARKMTIRVMGQTRTITIDKIQNNVDMPADRFALPPEVQQLLLRDK